MKNLVLELSLLTHYLVRNFSNNNYILCFNTFHKERASSMNKALMVTKRDGKLEPINLDKIHRVITWAAEGLENVSVSQVELRSHIQFYEGIRTFYSARSD